jgi:hypothetical protein
MKAWFGACLPLVVAATASAQGMSYSGAGHERQPDRIEQRSDSSALDWLNLPSDMTIGKWAQQHQDFFRDIDVNGDTVLSEEDLMKPDPELAKAWASAEAIEVFTIWLPQIEAHLRGLDDRSAGVASEHELLAPTAQASAQIRSIMQSLGLTGQSWSGTYLEAKVAGDPSVSNAGPVTANARSWVSVDVPVDLVFHAGGGEPPKVYSYTVTMLGIHRFPRHPEDDRFALWDIGLAARQIAD